MSNASSLPKGWCYTSLEKIASWGAGGTPSRNVERYFQGTIPWIKTGELEGKYIRNTEEHISEEALKNSSAKIFPKGSVGIAMYGATIGKLSIWGIDASTNQACAVGIPNEAINNEFLYYYLLSERQNLIKAGKGGAQPNLSQGIIKEWPINLPPLNEQHRIVAKIEELFSELDKGIENLKTAQVQLKVYRQALLKHAFEGKLTAQWREQNRDQLETAAALQQRIQQERAQRYQQQLADWEANGKQGSLVQRAGKPKAPKSLPPLTAEELAELPVLPEGWGWFKVGHICDVVRGGSPRPAGDPKFYGGNIPFLKVADITTTSTPYLSNFTYTITEAGLSKTRQIDPNTLLLSNSGATLGVPKICLISATMNDGVAAFLGLPHEALLYHYYFWESKTKHLRNIDQGAAQPNLNTDLIKETFISICSPSEQLAVTQKLEASLSEVDQLELTLTTSLQQAEALRQSILKRAFSGQLVAQDANDEPASVLLERIKAEKAAQAGMAKPRKPKQAAADPAPEKSNVIPFPVRLPNISATDLHAGILARAYQHHENTPKYLACFGHVKAEKIAHLVEAHLGIDLEREPIKDVAGPNDYPHLMKVESRARKANWFDVKKRKDADAYEFSKKHGFDALLLKTMDALGERADEVDALINLLLPLNSRQAEIVATLYAAWNNLLLQGQSPDDEAIVHEARENWHASKLNIERDKFFRGLQWMRDHGLVPAGRGRYVAKKS